MNPQQFVTVAFKQRRLLRIKRVATLLFLAMVVLFVTSHLGRRVNPAWGWLEAFAEAAMVGALADWFAVVALFRRPFGLPIPHTAILPTRKDEIAATLGNFVVENFLNREVVRKRLDQLNLVALALGWVRGSASELASHLCRIFPRILESLDHEEMAGLIQLQLERQILALPLAPLGGRILEMLTAGGRHEALLDEVLQQAGRLLAEHYQSIKQSIESEVPLPEHILGISLKALREPIVEWIADKLVAKVQSVLTDAGADREHPVRKRFRARVEQLVIDLKCSPEYAAKGEVLKRELLANPALRGYAAGIWSEIRRWLESAAQPGSRLQGRLETMIFDSATALQADPVFVEKINQWLRETLSDLIEKHRHGFGQMIEDRVSAWDPVEMSEKLELEVGADLQYIRINGTLIGGLVGLLIHTISTLF
jgi:uncharacterized membrane-anchored protein YjiN (DUF445 family)